jgi:ATP-dependent Zn protease
MTDSGGDRDLTGTAYHEAGHAVMGCLVGRVLTFATIVPDGTGAVGRTQYADDVPACARRYFDRSEEKKRYTEARVLSEIAAMIAQDLKEPGRPHDMADAEDARQARELVIELVSWEDDRDAYLPRAQKRATAILKEHWRWVEAVAQALLQRKTLTDAEIVALRPSGVVSPIPPFGPRDHDPSSS